MHHSCLQGGEGIASIWSYPRSHHTKAAPAIAQHVRIVTFAAVGDPNFVSADWASWPRNLNSKLPGNLEVLRKVAVDFAAILDFDVQIRGC